MESDDLWSLSQGDCQETTAVRSDAIFRAVLYLRMSTDKQETSVADQRRELTQYAKKKGYQIVGEYSDEGISGDATEKRVAFQRMVADSGKKRFDLILCWDQDRFGRFDPLEGGYWIKPIRDAGVQLETIAQGRIDWSDFASRLVWTITQEAKHAYLRTLSRDVLRGMRSSVCEGNYPGGAPYGYRKAGKRLVLGPPEEVETVREIFAMKISGMGHRTICAKLRNAGHPAPGGGVWTNGNIRYILERIAYTGAIRFGRAHQGKYSKPQEILIVEGTHEPIISRETYDAAKKSCKPSTVSYRHGRLAGPLAGLMTCGLCGTLMYRSKYRKSYGYICGRYHRGMGCGYCRIMEADAVRRVAQRLQEIVGTDIKQLKKSIEQKQQDVKADGKVAGLQKRISELDQQLERAAERILSVDDAMLPVVKKKLREMQQTRQRLLRELDDCQPATPDSPAAVAAKLMQLPSIIQQAPPEIVRAAVANYVAAIKVNFREREYGDKGYRSFELLSLDITLK